MQVLINAVGQAQLALGKEKACLKEALKTADKKDKAALKAGLKALKEKK